MTATSSARGTSPTGCCPRSPLDSPTGPSSRSAARALEPGSPRACSQRAASTRAPCSTAASRTGSSVAGARSSSAVAARSCDMTAPPANALARELFAPLGPTYDRYARLLSLGQDPRWRRFLVSRVPVVPTDTVLDVATGTAAVAIELARRTGCSVLGLDQSSEMLAAGRKRIALAAATKDIRLQDGRAEELPFEDGAFD